jgi:hypothetical protein
VTEPRTIIAARNYAEVTDGFAIRMAELRVNYLSVDVGCGLTEGHTNKLMSPKPTKHFGPRTFDKFLRKLGLMLIVAEDPDNPPQITDTREYAGPVPKSVEHHRKASREATQMLAKLMLKNSRKGARRSAAGRMKKIDPARRSEIAQHAARARWSRRQPSIVDLTGEARPA